MTMIKMTFDASDAIKRFEDIGKNLANPEKTMKIVAVEAQKGVLNNFDTSTGRNGKWPTWSRVEKGKRVYYNSRPYGRGGSKLLLDTGLLRSSIQYRAINREAHVYTNISYANYHEQAKLNLKNIPRRDFLWLNNFFKKKIIKIFNFYTFRK